MSVQHSREVWKRSFESSGLKLVALALADMANEHGDCWPSKATLALRGGLQWRYVRKCIVELAALGLVSVTERFKDNRQRSNIYTLHLPSPRAQLAQSGMSPRTPAPCPPGHPESSIEPSMSKETEVTCFVSHQQAATMEQPEWMTKPLSKEQLLLLVNPPKNAPSELDYDDFIETEGLEQIETYRPDLYQQLSQQKWHQWREDLHKWVRIRDWEAYVRALEEKIEEFA